MSRFANLEKVTLAIFAIAMLGLLPAKAQNATAGTSAGEKQNTLLPQYDLSKEIKLHGTIEKIDNSGDTAPLGTHLQIETSQGIVDAHLGMLNLASRKALGLSQGESVTITGMMENLGGNSVLLARILQTSSNIFVLRTRTGLPVRSLLLHGRSSTGNDKGGL
ncbi:MAG: hypothetical protein ACRD4S_17645 [Candidatus Acidiferrales bacterium]